MSKNQTVLDEGHQVHQLPSFRPFFNLIEGAFEKFRQVSFLNQPHFKDIRNFSAENSNLEPLTNNTHLTHYGRFCYCILTDSGVRLCLLRSSFLHFVSTAVQLSDMSLYTFNKLSRLYHCLMFTASKTRIKKGRLWD